MNAPPEPKELRTADSDHPPRSAARASFDPDGTEPQERDEARTDQPLPQADAGERRRARASSDPDGTEPQERDEGRTDQPLRKSG
ncbi:MAG: hypothetical protein GY856_14785 [bacterium]|nr:hypothetical protein [bacterium]